MKLLKIFSLIIILAVLLLPNLYAVKAAEPAATGNDKINQAIKTNLDKIGTEVGYGKSADVTSSTLAAKVGQVFSLAISFLGIVFLFLIVYSGIQWMTAGGNEERIEKARTRIIRAIIGLAITMSAFALTRFVVTRLQTVATTPANSQQANNPTNLPSCHTKPQADCLTNPSHCQWKIDSSSCEAIPYTSTVGCDGYLQGDCTSVAGSDCQWSGTSCVSKPK